uniref:Olfactory receptor n=1 Tax=Sander lucioperca TaxID=283035 RepID=A0A8D0D6W6_SANLU
MINSTQVSYFKLAAYFDTGVFKYLFFLIIMCFYAVIICANVLLIVVICVNRSLHEPMYLFLCSLFVNELFGSTGLFPFLLIFCLYSYGGVELWTLAIMSYDRYLAILSGLTAPLQLCGNIINKVYCDNYYVVKLACSDTTANNIFGLVHMFTVIFALIILILFSYMGILKVCFSGSKQTRQKALSTCTPHLFSLLNFSFGAFFEIVQSRFNMNYLPNMLRIVLSLYWLTCQPLINPLLYGLKMSKIRSICRRLLFGGEM